VYGFYWHGKNWGNTSWLCDDDEAMPIMREMFSVFFIHSLFSVTDMRIIEKEKGCKWKPIVWATIGVMTLLASRVIDRRPVAGGAD
jgi:hypothetical protein